MPERAPGESVDVEAIEALHQRALPPPWEAGHPLDQSVTAMRQPVYEQWIPQSIDDSRLAATLRNAWPALRDELLWLRGQNAMLSDALVRVVADDKALRAKTELIQTMLEGMIDRDEITAAGVQTIAQTLTPRVAAREDGDG